MLDILPLLSEARTLASILGGYLSANATNLNRVITVLEIVSRDFHTTDAQISADLEADHRRLSEHR